MMSNIKPIKTVKIIEISHEELWSMYDDLRPMMNSISRHSKKTRNLGDLLVEAFVTKHYYNVKVGTYLLDENTGVVVIFLKETE